MKVVAYCVGTRKIQHQVELSDPETFNNYTTDQAVLPEQLLKSFRFDSTTTVYSERPIGLDTVEGNCCYPIFKILVDERKLTPRDSRGYLFNGYDTLGKIEILSASYASYYNRKRSTNFAAMTNQFLSQEFSLDSFQVSWDSQSLATFLKFCDWYINGGFNRNHKPRAILFKQNLGMQNGALDAENVLKLCLDEMDFLLLQQQNNVNGDYFKIISGMLQFFQPMTLACSSKFHQSSKDRLAFYQHRMNIFNIFDSYVSSFKFRLFGHRHNERAASIARAILASPDKATIDLIYENQTAVLAGNESGSVVRLMPLLPPRWTNRLFLKNVPDKNSGYSKVMANSKNYHKAN